MHCAPWYGQPTRPGGATGPTVVLDVTASGVRGVASVGSAEYQDEYAKTPQGWRFASRTVITAAEKATGLEARDLLAISAIRRRPDSATTTSPIRTECRA